MILKYCLVCDWEDHKALKLRCVGPGAEVPCKLATSYYSVTAIPLFLFLFFFFSSLSVIP